jgi:hypothetical protein
MFGYSPFLEEGALAELLMVFLQKNHQGGEITTLSRRIRKTLNCFFA